MSPWGTSLATASSPCPRSARPTSRLPLTVPKGHDAGAHPGAGSGKHRFAVEGRATFSTPFGRRNVRFAHAGDLAFGGGSEVEVGTGYTADSIRMRRGPHAPRLPSVRPMTDEGPPPDRGGREPR